MKRGQEKGPNIFSREKQFSECNNHYTCFFLEFSFFKYSAKNSFVIGHQTSAHCTFAMKPPFTKSNQLASYNLGPIRKFRSVILSSSLTSVAVDHKQVYFFSTNTFDEPHSFYKPNIKIKNTSKSKLAM